MDQAPLEKFEGATFECAVGGVMLFRPGVDPEIRMSVIRHITIDVVNRFVRLQWTAKHTLGSIPVLCPVAASLLKPSPASVMSPHLNDAAGDAKGVSDTDNCLLSALVAPSRLISGRLRICQWRLPP